MIRDIACRVVHDPDHEARNIRLRSKRAPSSLQLLTDYNHSLKHCSTRLLRLQQISSKRPALVAFFIGPSESARIGLFERLHPPLIHLFYQVEIRRTQVTHRKIANRRAAAGDRDDTTRLWRLRGCYIECLHCGVTRFDR
jgi:hypothetical protein